MSADLVRAWTTFGFALMVPATLWAGHYDRRLLVGVNVWPKPFKLALSIHKDHQGKRHARSLLLFAKRTALRASREIGSFDVITHPIDDPVCAFCGRWGFQDLPFEPYRAMIVRMVDIERSGIK
jgi:GNAT superfamily N-acetyltransferase